MLGLFRPSCTALLHTAEHQRQPAPFAAHRDSRMLGLFRSRCTMRRECRNTRPLAMSSAIWGWEGSTRNSDACGHPAGRGRMQTAGSLPCRLPAVLCSRHASSHSTACLGGMEAQRHQAAQLSLAHPAAAAVPRHLARHNVARQVAALQKGAGLQAALARAAQSAAACGSQPCAHPSSNTADHSRTGLAGKQAPPARTSQYSVTSIAQSSRMQAP